jgi:hypothetical protein
LGGKGDKGDRGDKGIGVIPIGPLGGWVFMAAIFDIPDISIKSDFRLFYQSQSFFKDWLGDIIQVVTGHEVVFRLIDGSTGNTVKTHCFPVMISAISFSNVCCSRDADFPELKVKIEFFFGRKQWYHLFI